MIYFPTLRASSSRMSSSRLFSSNTRILQKAPLTASTEASTPEELLAKVGRNADKKLTAYAKSWETLNQVWFKTKKMKDSGLAVKERRYILWAFSRYSQGSPLSSFIRPPRLPKKFRGANATPFALVSCPLRYSPIGLDNDLTISTCGL
nr:hypothetical protein L203_01702 [Cryptococcus depauperatus CBS 7841]